MVGRAGAVFCALTALAFATAAPARADGQFGACTFGSGPYQYQGFLGPLMATAEAVSRKALGDQFTLLWMDSSHQGWDIGFAPGPLDADAARAAIVAELRADMPADQADLLERTLLLVPQPYSWSELHAIAQELPTYPFPGSWYAVTASIACTQGEPVRVEVGFWNDGTDPTPEQLAGAQAGLAQFGDKVYARYYRDLPSVGDPASPAPPPAPPAPPPAPVAKPPRVASYVTLASTRRCVRGRAITVKARRTAGLKTLAVVARGHRATLKPGRATRVKLAAHGATNVAVTVTLASGTAATKTYRFTRC